MSKPPSPISVLDTDPLLARYLDPRAYDHETAFVAAMHGKYDLGVARQPTLLDRKRMLERLECLAEELSELATAVLEDDLPKIADALIDLTVFAKGTGVLLGLPWARLFDDVMRANNAKVRGVGHRGHAVDLVKPPGWQGPKTEEILEAYGWQREVAPLPECTHCNDRGCTNCDAGDPSEEDPINDDL